MDKTHKQGMIDGIELYGRVCSTQANCEECPIGSIRGTGVTCQDFARQFPSKMYSILKEMDEGEITFFEEYCTRFPNCQLPVEVLSACTCRKAVFEGYLDCPVDPSVDEEACVRCWNEAFVGNDITVTDEQYEADMKASGNNMQPQMQQQINQSFGQNIEATGNDFDINSLTSLR